VLVKIHIKIIKVRASNGDNQTRVYCSQTISDVN